MLLSFLLLMTILAWSLGTAVFASDPEGKPPALGTKQQSSPPFMSGGICIRVLWTVSEYRVGKNEAWGEEEARKLLFKPLDMDATRITFDGKTCRDVIFKKEKINAKEYLDHIYHTTPQGLGIEEETVGIVKTNCDLPGFAEFIRLRDGRLIIHLKGVFFYFTPAVNY